MFVDLFKALIRSAWTQKYLAAGYMTARLWILRKFNSIFKSQGFRHGLGLKIITGIIIKMVKNGTILLNK